MKILKVFDLANVTGTLALVGPVYRVEIVAADRRGELETHVRDFPHGTAAEKWLMSMVAMHASGIAVKRGTGGRATALHFDQSPVLGEAPRSPAACRLKHERAS